MSASAAEYKYVQFGRPRFSTSSTTLLVFKLLCSLLDYNLLVFNQSTTCGIFDILHICYSSNSVQPADLQSVLQSASLQLVLRKTAVLQSNYNLLVFSRLQICCPSPVDLLAFNLFYNLLVFSLLSARWSSTFSTVYWSPSGGDLRLRSEIRLKQLQLGKGLEKNVKLINVLSVK
jgi:hypothetical protein